MESVMRLVRGLRQLVLPLVKYWLSEVAEQAAHTLAVEVAAALCTSTNFRSLLLDSRMQSLLELVVHPYLFHVFQTAMAEMDMHHK